MTPIPTPPNGFIDGSAPPFILLSVVIAGMIHSNSLYNIPENPKIGRGFRRIFMYAVYILQVLFLLIAAMIIYRIANNSNRETFFVLDTWIIIGVILLFSSMATIGHLTIKIKR